MVSIQVTTASIRNGVCIVCGKSFITPRAGKLYCGSSCKQFAFYHKTEINKLETFRNNKNDSSICLSLRDYSQFSNLINKISRYHTLDRRSKSEYSSIDFEEGRELDKIERSLPEYLRNLKPPMLSIEEWSFLKILYPNLKLDEFVNLIGRFDHDFFRCMKFSPEFKSNQKENPITALFQNHLGKIAEGKIRFT